MSTFKNLAQRACLVAAAAGMTMVAASAWAASSTASAVSDSVGTLSGSVSGSLERSSDSSKTKTAAQGNYTVVAVATPAQQPGMVRLALQAVATPGADGVLFLTLPKQAFDRSALTTGETVRATTRPYGVEFARGDNQQAFFLALADDWVNELDARALI